LEYGTDIALYMGMNANKTRGDQKMRKRHHMKTKKLQRELREDISFKKHAEKVLKTWSNYLDHPDLSDHARRTILQWSQAIVHTEAMICRKLQRLHFANY
jgi:hypothetical protein